MDAFERKRGRGGASEHVSNDFSPMQNRPQRRDARLLYALAWDVNQECDQVSLPNCKTKNQYSQGNLQAGRKLTLYQHELPSFAQAHQFGYRVDRSWFAEFRG